MILLIDNYDSFVHNLARYLGILGHERRVVRHDAIGLEGVETLAPSAIVISPGPCAPRDAGISLDVIRHFAGRIPILGVCLGHQCIGEVFGGKTVRAPSPVHGKTSPIFHDGTGLFAGLPSPFLATRYHSLLVDLPAESPLDVAARCDQGLIMAVAHKTLPVWGVQFHPEAILTEHGMDILRNFLKKCEAQHSP